jgi:hypothetical protein
MCPPCRNNSPSVAPYHVDHYDFNVFYQADGEHAVFTVTAVNPLQHRPVKRPLDVPKIDAVFCEVGLPLAFIPLEKLCRPLG